MNISPRLTRDEKKIMYYTCIICGKVYNSKSGLRVPYANPMFFKTQYFCRFCFEEHRKITKKVRKGAEQ